MCIRDRSESFFFKQKTAYEISLGLVRSEMCIRDRYSLKVIEKNKNTAKLISEALSSAVVLNSDIADENMLRDESIEDVDYFCAVTSDDQVNILSAKLAKEMGASKTISIVTVSYTHLTLPTKA